MNCAHHRQETATCGCAAIDMHDGRLLTLDDTVEYFNLVLSTKLTDQEKKDLVAFMRAL